MIAWRTLLTFLGVALVLWQLPARTSEASTAPEFVVIVNDANRTVAANKQLLAQAFLKKVKTWPGGGAIRPVDLHASSDVRERFSRRVLDRSTSAVRRYWQQVLFSGRDVPPPEYDSEHKVIRYVASHAGGVGYVSRSEKLDLRGVKVLEVEGL